jgi:predicted ArsR family transcriptional regulator
MEHVLNSDDPLSVREVAEHFGLHVNAVRIHLEKLVKGGLLRVVRRRGGRGGRPAFLYRASDEDLELHLPPRRYKLLAEVLAQGISSLREETPPSVAREAFRCGREEAIRSASPLAYLPPGAGAVEVAKAWMDEVSGGGLKADYKEAGGRVEVTFHSCPFGEFSRRYPGLVCEIHRCQEEGFLSLAGEWRVTASEEDACTFVLEAGPQKR